MMVVGGFAIAAASCTPKKAEEEGLKIVVAAEQELESSDLNIGGDKYKNGMAWMITGVLCSFPGALTNVVI